MNKLDNLTESASVAIADRVRSMEARGERVIRLQTGDPDFPTPREIIDAACAAMNRGDTHYSMSRGLPELREAIAAKLARDNDLQCDPRDEVLVTHGGVHAVFIAIAALAGAGDEVLVLDPSWMPYAAATTLAGATAVRVGSSPDCGFRPQIEAIRSSISPRTRLMVINTPCNPTGVVLSSTELADLARIALEHDLIVVADEVYEKIIFAPFSHVSIASLPHMRERTITINSFSKTYAMTGWRVGYLAGPASLVRQILKVCQYTITNIAPFVQSAAVHAISHKNCAKYTEEMRVAYSRRLQLALQSLAGTERIKVSTPGGTFYLMLDISLIGSSSERVASAILESKQVATVPGIAYGSCAEGFLRLSLTVSEEDLVEASSRIAEFARSTEGV